MNLRLAWAACALGVAAPPLAGQVTFRPGGGGLVLNVRARSAASAGATRVSGTAVGVAGTGWLGRFALDIRYLEGTLQPADTSSPRRELVEGTVAIQFRATPWLVLAAGPHARSYTTPAGSERWVAWRAGGRAEMPIIGAAVRGHAALWQSLALSVNVPPGSGTTRGGDVGVTLDVPHGPFWFALAYAIDHAEVRGGVRRETVESLTFTAGVRRR